MTAVAYQGPYGSKAVPCDGATVMRAQLQMLKSIRRHLETRHPFIVHECPRPALRPWRKFADIPLAKAQAFDGRLCNILEMQDSPPSTAIGPPETYWRREPIVRGTLAATRPPASGYWWHGPAARLVIA
jgi:hypothetical protein